MYRSMPIYLPGDTIRLKLKVEHEANLVGLWAEFEKKEDVPVLKHHMFAVRLRDRNDLRQLDRNGAHMISEAILKAPVSKDDPLPGIYELYEVHGLPVGEERNAGNVLNFEVPYDIRFRVVAPTGDWTPKVTQWDLGWEA